MGGSVKTIYVSVAVIEHDQVEREYLAALLGTASGIVVAGTYATLAEFLKTARQARPGIILVDAAELDRFGDHALPAIHSEQPQAAVVVLSADLRPDTLLAILEHGISGWLDKPCPADHLIRSILRVRDAEAVLDCRAARMLVDLFRARGSMVNGLSKRERVIFHYLAQGLHAHAIAAQLDLSTATVRSHLHNILAKMGVDSQTAALAKYFNPISMRTPTPLGSFPARS
jgi:DNA-binding NarL/FixJ family response regulator